MYFYDVWRACVKHDTPIRRKAWKPNKYIHIRPAESDSMSYPELVYTDGSGERAPWTPTRCDLLEEDWEIEYRSA